jgi:septum site-determining protein MinC
MINGIGFNLRRRQIVIRVDEDVDARVVAFTLKKKMGELKKLYKDAEPKILVTGKSFKLREREEIQKVFAKYFDSEVKFDGSKMLGLYGIRKPFNREIASSETKFVRTSLRSGQRAEYEGSIVVLGDVNGGAEVIAGENVVVLGCIRGMVHAGAKGNKEAIITAGSIEATQIRISNVVKECEPEDFEDSVIKTNAYIDNHDEIIIE